MARRNLIVLAGLAVVSVCTVFVIAGPAKKEKPVGHISARMSDEVKGIASVADQWHAAWRNNDRETFVGLMRSANSKLADNMLLQGKRLFAEAEGISETCLMVSRTDQSPSIATVHLYPMSLGGRRASIEISMSRQEGKWYVLAAKYIEVDDLASHYQRWADKYDKYEIWYDANAPEWLRPGQKGSEVAKKIAEIKVSDRKLYEESYGHLLGDIRKELSEGSRLQRLQLLKVIRKRGLSTLFEESVIGPLKACLKSKDAEVVKLAREMYGHLKKEVRRKLETDASKIPHSPEEFRSLADKYSEKVSELEKALAKYRSKAIFSDYLDVLENEVFPLIHKGKIAGEQEGKRRSQDPDAFKNSAYDEKESKPAIIDICAAALKGIYGKFGTAVEEGTLRLPDDEQNMIFYGTAMILFQSSEKLVEKPYEEHCPFEQGTMEYYQFMDDVGQSCVLISSPLMIMIKQLPDELEDAKEEVEIMYKWLEAGKGRRGDVAMPALYKEAYLNEIDELAVKEGFYETKD